MPILYIITGPAGVGKSTISKELAMSSNKSVLIEGDDIYHQVVRGYTPAWKDGNHLQTFWKVCMNIFQIYLDDGYDVIFNYIVTPKNIAFGGGVGIYKNSAVYKINFNYLIFKK